MSRPSVLLAPLLFGSLAAQTPPSGPIPSTPVRLDAEPAKGSPAATRAALGRDAFAAGRKAEAVEHFLAALQFHPASPTLLVGLLEASAEDAGARAMWAHRYWRAVADGKGRARIDRTVQKLLPDDAAPKRLTKLRADTVAELARFVTKLKPTGRQSLGNGLLARWATDLAFELMRGSPALLREYGPAFEHACASFDPDFKSVIAALQKLMNRPPRATRSAVDPEDPTAVAAAAEGLRKEQSIAIRAARCLAGLGAQANFKDLEGPQPPPLGNAPAAARRVIEELRAKVEARVGKEWTVEELLDLGPAEREQFTQDHSDWANPGIAISPNGKYQIQTICGFESLLGAADTVEYHHDRLADFFGKNPFGGRRGVVVIQPEHAGLEEEGSPDRWAGGFQRGDRTTIRFAWNSIPGMGRTLTHELTHRFDGAIYPFQPSWLVEGKAVWTGSAYTRMRDASFYTRHLKSGPCVSAYVKGYGDERKLKRLIEGTIDDYRDNYTAGYALYTYLSSWPPDGEPLYRERLDRFMKNARGGRNKPIEFFESMFCDGADGRPAGVDSFAADFQSFLRGIYRWSWRERDDSNAFVARYFPGRQPKGDPNRLVEDEPTYSWARRRAEPWFGERHAFLAGELLREAGDPRAAAAVYLWSLRTDGWQPRAVIALADILASLGLKGAAWVATHEGRIRFPGAFPGVPDPIPALRTLPKVRALQKGLGEVSMAYAASRSSIAELAIRAEHQALAAAVGTAMAHDNDGGARAVEPGLYPVRENPVQLGLFGWTESGLTGYEERRVAGLWYEASTADLHVGRKKARDDTGMKDRRARQRHAFVRTAEWQPPGEYVIHTRVHFTTSFVAGAIVFGHTRRDRNIRLEFSAGDFLYSIGRAEDAHETDAVNLNLKGPWERDANNHIPGTNPYRGYQFDKPSSWFDVQLHVRGPSVVVSIMGEPWMRYTTPDGSPIEGAIGFAMRQGAVRVQQPTIQRLDRDNLSRDSRESRRAAVASVGFDLGSSAAEQPEDLVLRPTRNVPLHEDGTVLVLVPPGEDAEDTRYYAERALRRLAKYASNPAHYPQRWVLAVPAELAAADVEVVQNKARELREDGFEIVRHRRGAPFDEDTWVLFVDGTGILRALVESGDAAIGLRIERWARRYRGR